MARPVRRPRGSVIGIIGGGISGLVVHHELQQRGIESVVFEMEAEPGGVMRTIERDGRYLDCGPQRTRRTPPVESLIDAYDLQDRVLEAEDAPLFVYYNGKLCRAPLSLREAVSTDLLSWRGKARLLLEPACDPTPRDGETVHQYLARTFGHEFAARLGGPLYAGLYASDPAEMPVQYSLARALDRFGIDGSILLALLRNRLRGRTPPPVVSFDQGMQVLPRALAHAHPEHVRLESPVREVIPEGDGYDISTDRETVHVDAVVCTTSAGVASSLLADVDAESAEALKQLNYNPLVVVHVEADTDLHGSGHQIPVQESTVTRGVTWNTSLFSTASNRHGVYTCYLGGARQPDILEWSDDRLTDHAVREFTRVMGAEAAPLHLHRVDPGMPAYDHSWEALERVSLPDDVLLCANYVDRAGIPGRISHAGRVAARLGEA